MSVQIGGLWKIMGEWGLEGWGRLRGRGGEELGAGVGRGGTIRCVIVTKVKCYLIITAVNHHSLQSLLIDPLSALPPSKTASSCLSMPGGAATDKPCG